MSDGRIKAVVFDMDGVLLDSREMIYAAFTDTLGRYGLSATHEQISNVIGKPVKAMYELLAPGQDALQLEAQHLAHHAENPQLVKAYEAARETLIALRNEGRKTAVFTGFNAGAYDRLDQINVSDCLDTIVEATQYKEHKPSPEGLLLALGRLSVYPENAVYVGDAKVDVEAGRAANIKAMIGISHGFTPDTDLYAAGADYVIDSLQELPAIIQRIESREL